MWDHHSSPGRGRLIRGVDVGCFRVTGHYPVLRILLHYSQTPYVFETIQHLIEAPAEEPVKRRIGFPERAEWGDGVVEELARYVSRTQSGLRGFTRAKLFRMRQLYET